MSIFRSNALDAGERQQCRVSIGVNFTSTRINDLGKSNETCPIRLKWFVPAVES